MLPAPRLLHASGLLRALSLRAASTSSSSRVADAGYIQYSRNVSRDKKNPNPQQQGDTPYRFLTRRLGHAYEVYPLLALCATWFAFFLAVSYYSFHKMEVWLDRSQQCAPWDWERIRDDYWKRNTVAFDMDGRTHKRLEIMEQLQNEMVEAAKKRGTR